MNTTAANILKILSQSEMSVDDMQLYLEVEKSSIIKSILQFNEFLKSINLPTIEKSENLYSLNLSNQQMKTLFNNFNTLTLTEKIDYLYIKFIATGFLNLEKEKENLDISRSTILRAFKTVKETFAKNGTTYEYVHGKGLVLKNLSQIDKGTFCKKLMIFFIEEDILVPSRKKLLDSIKKFDTKERMEKLYPILSSSDISINYVMLSFVHTLEICVDLFGGFNFKRDYEYKDFSDIENIIKSNLKDYDALYQQQIFYFIISLKRDEINFEPSTLEKAFKTIEEVKEKFNLNNLNPFLEKMLLKKICFSIFKYENHIFKVKSSTITNKEKTLLNILDNILKKYNLNLFFCDKISIIQIIVKIIIEHNKDSLKNILLLFNEVIILDDDHLKDSLYNNNKKFNFHIEPTFFYKLNPENYENKYDLILSDEPSLNSKTIVVNSFNSMQVLSAIYGYIFDKAIENFSYK